MIDACLGLLGLRGRRFPVARGSLFVRTAVAATPRRGRPLLFVHGFGRGGQLLPLALAFRDVRDVVVPDLLDLGGASRSLRGTTDVFEQADALAELLEETGPADVVGVSFGGWVALWLAARHPELVSSLFLLNPAGLREGAEELDELYRSTARAPELYRRIVGGRPFLGVPGVSRALEHGFRRVLDTPELRRFLDTVSEAHFVEPALDRIVCPTYALLSTNDELLRPQATAKALLARVREVDGAWIVGASHNAGYEAFEIVVERLATFLGLGAVPTSAVLRAAAHLTVPPELRPLRARPGREVSV